MDRFQFGKLINVLSHWGMRELELHEVKELDVLIAPNPVSTQERPIVSEQVVTDLMSAMREGRKIDAIKAYRSLTNAGLKESKDAV